jgi:predicted lysophospholipase L1 biosynthesis ABC-type transport system permease subunit
LGALGLILAIVGVYGVISYAANQRHHEIGIRLALGARPFDILRMIFREGLLIVVIGISAGVAGTFAAAHGVSSYLVGVSAMDPLAYAAASLMLALVALGACYLPARRAMRSDPMLALGMIERPPVSFRSRRSPRIISTLTCLSRSSSLSWLALQSVQQGLLNPSSDSDLLQVCILVNSGQQVDGQAPTHSLSNRWAARRSAGATPLSASRAP